MDRQFASARAKEISFNADQVPQIQKLEKLKVALTHRLQANINLKPLTSAGQMGKTGLAVRANCHDAPGHADRNLLGAQFFSGSCRIRGHDLRDGMRKIELARIRLKAQVLDGTQLLLPLLD